MYNLSINYITNHGFIFFQDKILESTKEISKRTLGIALIALGCLAAIYATYLCCASCDEFINDYEPYNPLDTHTTKKPHIVQGSNLFPQHQIHQLEGEEEKESSVDLSTLEEEKKVIKAIRANWLDDSQKELQRMADANLFPSTIQSTIPISTALNISNIFSLTPTLQIQQMYSVMGRVLEIKNLYRHTHYVFTHGQAPEISVANQIMKELVRHFTPRLHHPFKIPFRLPHTVAYSENADEFVNQYKANEGSFFDDASHSDKMLSVDAQFWNTQIQESALDFFSSASNIISGDGQLLSIFKSIFANYLPHDEICSMLAGKALKIAKQKKTETMVGILYAICIPKEIIQDDKKNFAYPCHPYGRKCECFETNDRTELLEAMQRNQHVICQGGYFSQYRILTSRLTEEKDVRTFAVDAMSKNKRKFYRNQVKELVKELTLYSHLSDLIEKLEKDPSVIDQINSLVETSPQLDQKYIHLLLTTKPSPLRNQNHPFSGYVDDFEDDSFFV